MPQYINLLREASILSIYFLFAEVIIFLIFKGKINNRNLQIFAYVWLPLAVATQILMTYSREVYHISNLSIMNIYLMFEFVILTYLLLRIREDTKGVKLNYKIWSLLILSGILIHFTNELNSLHPAAMLFMAIIYFNLSISYVDLENSDQFIADPYTLLNIGVFVKAFGYSYFTVYQIDYKFPLSVYSGVNLLAQLIFFLTIYAQYKSQRIKSK